MTWRRTFDFASSNHPFLGIGKHVSPFLIVLCFQINRLYIPSSISFEINEDLTIKRILKTFYITPILSL
jgi:hypothetical protein